MGRERRDQNPQPSEQSAEITAAARVFALVEPEESATISYEDLVMRGCQIVIDHGSVEAIADKMLRQSLFQAKESGICKTTHERSRKNPVDHREIGIKLRRKYKLPLPIRFDVEHSQFVFESRITDPPPPCHDLGDLDLEDLDVLSRDPEVLEIFVEDQSRVPQVNEEGMQTKAVQDDEEKGIFDSVEAPVEDEQHVVAEESFSTSDGEVVTITITTEDIDDQMRPEEATLKPRDPAFARAHSVRREDDEFYGQDYTRE